MDNDTLTETASFRISHDLARELTRGGKKRKKEAVKAIKLYLRQKDVIVPKLKSLFTQREFLTLQKIFVNVEYDPAFVSFDFVESYICDMQEKHRLNAEYINDILERILTLNISELLILIESVCD